MRAIPASISGRSRRALLTTVDQSLFSLSNFMVAVAIARIAGPVGLGSYSLAYALWLAFQALHRALITDPMAIENQARQAEAKRHLAAGFASEMALGVAATAILAVLGATLLLAGQHTFGISLLALAPWLPALLAQDYWRWVGFLQGRPEKALTNDLVFGAVQGSLFGILIAVGMRSPVVAISAWGTGAASGALFGAYQFNVWPTLGGGLNKLKSHWPISRWLSANSLIAWGSSQSYAVLTAAILGPVGVGAIRAAQTLVGGVALVLLQSAGSLGLPEACRALADRGVDGLRNVTRFITTAAVVAVGALAVVVAVDGDQLLRIFYGSRFGRYGTAATILALSLVVSAMSIGAILTLKATRQTGRLFAIIFSQMIVTVIAVSVLSALIGVTGAAAGIGLGCVTATTGLLISQRQTIRRWDAPESTFAGTAWTEAEGEATIGRVVVPTYPMPAGYGPLGSKV